MRWSGCERNGVGGTFGEPCDTPLSRYRFALLRDGAELIATAMRLEELESALEFLDGQAYMCASFLDPRKPTPHSKDETETTDAVTAPALLRLARELGWEPKSIEPKGDRNK